jgi:hypothetical protein
MAPPRYIKILNNVARGPFKAMRLMQRSPTIWLDDQAWWTTIIELQSSKRGDGAFLNVGVCWLFYPKDYLSFDLGYREIEFAAYEGEPQFALIAKGFVERATAKAAELRDALATVAGAWSFVRHFAHGQQQDAWWVLQEGVLAGLADDWKFARAALTAVASTPTQWDWEAARSRYSARLLEATVDRESFRLEVADGVLAGRTALKLPPVDRGMLFR